jgi:paraquat-inducible protein B
MHFNSSLKGLSKGAPVEFKGVEIGKVVDFELTLDQKTLNVKAPVLVELHPETITDKDNNQAPSEIVDEWISQGLRAQLATANILTGQLYIDLKFHKNSRAPTKTKENNITVFPTTITTFDELSNSVTSTLKKISEAPILELSNELLESMKNLNLIIEPNNKDNTIAEINNTLKHLKQLSTKLNNTIPSISKKLDDSLTKFGQTLDGTKDLVSKDSPILYEAREMLKSLSESARSFSSLSNFLERNPSALLYGKPGSKQ